MTGTLDLACKERFGVSLRALCMSMAVVVATTTSCSSAQEPSNGQELRENSSECTGHEVRETCGTVALEGSEYRYSLHKPDGGLSRDTVLIDLGGPGTALLSGEHELSRLAEEYIFSKGDYNVIFIEEPWVAQPVPEQCRLAMSEFYDTARNQPAGARSAANPLHEACDLESGLWGHNPEAYQLALKAISEQEGIEIVGFLGLSFGSARWSYLGDMDLDWTVLHNPFPLGVHLKDVLATRGTGVSDTLSSESDGDILETEAENSFDFLSAAVRIGYLEGDRRDELIAALDAGDQNLVSQASRDTWSAYSDKFMRPSYLALLEEVCRFSAAEIPEVDVPRSPEDILYLIHAPCSGVGEHEPIIPSVRSLCVSSSRSDIVSDQELVESAFKRLPLPQESLIFETNEGGHSSTDGLGDCLEEIL